MAQRQIAIEIEKSNGTRRYWTGSDNLEFRNSIFEGTTTSSADGTTGQLISITAPESRSGTVGARAKFSIALANETLRREFSHDLGSAPVRLWWIYPAVVSAPGPFEERYGEDLSAQSAIQQAITGNISSDIIFSASANGTWRANPALITGSAETGPGRNNALRHMYYEGSAPGTTNSPVKSFFSIDGGSSRTASIASWLTSSAARQITLRCCLMGSHFRNINNKLYLWHSISDPDRNDSAMIRRLYGRGVSGWAYRDDYTAGQTVTDYDGRSFIVAADGGWRDVTFTVPAGALNVGFAVDTFRPAIAGTSAWQSDVAITDITITEQVSVATRTWAVADEFSGILSAPVISPQNATYSAVIESLSGREGRGRKKVWSDVQQLADYPASANPDGVKDLIFENVEAIRKGEVKIRWY